MCCTSLCCNSGKSKVKNPADVEKADLGADHVVKAQTTHTFWPGAFPFSCPTLIDRPKSHPAEISDPNSFFPNSNLTILENDTQGNTKSTVAHHVVGLGREDELPVRKSEPLPPIPSASRPPKNPMLHHAVRDWEKKSPPQAGCFLPRDDSHASIFPRAPERDPLQNIFG